jgi:hypothetical protein
MLKGVKHVMMIYHQQSHSLDRNHGLAPQCAETIQLRPEQIKKNVQKLTPCSHDTTYKLIWTHLHNHVSVHLGTTSMLRPWIPTPLPLNTGPPHILRQLFQQYHKPFITGIDCRDRVRCIVSSYRSCLLLEHCHVMPKVEDESVKSPIPFKPGLNNTSVYWLNSKVHPGVMAVKGEKELSKQG